MASACKENKRGILVAVGQDQCISWEFSKFIIQIRLKQKKYDSPGGYLQFRFAFFNTMPNILGWIYVYIYIGVSKNRGTPKWMVYDGKPY